MKKSILAIGMVVLFAGLTCSPITAQVPESEFTVTYGVANNDGTVTEKETTMTEKEGTNLQTVLAELIEKLENAEISSYEEFLGIIGNFPFFEGRHPILAWIFNLLSIYRPPRTRALVFSHGWGFKKNLLKANEMSVYRPFTLWQYSSRSRLTIPIPAKTFIMRFSPFDVRFLQGTQLGFMTRFIGLYIYISQPLPQKSYTLFLGTARHVGGLDFKLSPLLG
jgi:hypothetical protein